MTKPVADLDYYKRVLAGERVPMTAEDPRHGYYRYMRSAVAIYPGPHGNTIVEVNGIALEDEEKIQNAWVGSASKPIPVEVFKHRISTGRWPEEEALIEKSASLAKNLKTLADMCKAHVKKLSSKKIEEGETIISNQLEADTAAGYVQQIRALMSSAEETIKLQVQPLKEQEKEIKAVWVDPSATIEESKEFLLDCLSKYGTDLMRKSNDPENFKFAAGKAGDGKTIGLRKEEALVVEDYNVLLKKFGKEPKVVEALQKALTEAAKVAWKAEKVAPKGTKVVKEYKAV